MVWSSFTDQHGKDRGHEGGFDTELFLHPRHSSCLVLHHPVHYVPQIPGRLEGSVRIVIQSVQSVEERLSK